MGSCTRRSLRLLALVLLALGRADARSWAQTSAPATQGAARARVAEAWKLLQAGRTDAALRELQAVLAVAPESAQAHYVLGAALEQAKDVSGAVDGYRAAIRYDPKLAEARDRLGFLLGELGRTQEAIDEFREAVRLKPGLWSAQYHLGATLWWTKDLDGAIRALEAAAALQPKHAAVLYYVGRSYRQSGKPAEALGPLERAVRRSRPCARLTWSWASPARSSATHRARSRPSGARSRSSPTTPTCATAWA